MTMLKMMVYGLAAMLFCSPVLAESGAYQIELIVFSQAMPSTEVFKQTDSQIQWPSGLTDLSAYKKPDSTALDDSYAALAKDSTYRPMLHIAWIQPAGNGPVRIQDADGKLNGYLQLQHEQNLQMTIDLEFSANRNDNSGRAVIYRLNEKRPIKLNEVYYFDHPKFGVIAKTSPVN